MHMVMVRTNSNTPHAHQSIHQQRSTVVESTSRQGEVIGRDGSLGSPRRCLYSATLGRPCDEVKRGHRLGQNDEALTQGLLVEELKDPRQVLRSRQTDPLWGLAFRFIHRTVRSLLFVVAAHVWRSLWLCRLPYLVRAQ
jgi:hypothetical protein